MSNSKQQNKRYQGEQTPEKIDRLGDTLSGLMDNCIVPKQEMFESIAQVWDELLPVEIRHHCRMTDISGGQLNVLIDSPSYMYSLQLYTSEILEELRRCCPQGRIKKIKLILA